MEEQEGRSILATASETLLLILGKYKSSQSESELKHFYCSIEKNRQLSKFYGMPKVHKLDNLDFASLQSIPLCPVINQCVSFAAVASTFLDSKLQPLTKTLHGYVKNSFSILSKLGSLKALPATATLCTIFMSLCNQT